MQPDSTPKIIDELKAAGQELKNTPAPKSEQSEGHPRSLKSGAQQSSSKTSARLASRLPKPDTGGQAQRETGGKEETDVLKKIAAHQQELSQEESILEKKHQQIQELEKKLAARIKLLKKLQTKGTEINKELKEFEEQSALVKKENGNLLDQIKNLLH